MAERRMFAKTIIDSDAFIDMPTTTRLLYYDLAMRADDDGFINSPKKICRMTGASDDDLKILAMKKFIIPFESGVVVIKHWKIHNYIRKDTYIPTKYWEEMKTLSLDENKSYTQRPRLVDGSSTQDRLGEERLGEERLGEERESNSTLFAPPTLDEVKAYCQERGNSIDAQRFIDYYTANGWKVGKVDMEDWRAAVRNWETYEKGKQADKQNSSYDLENFFELAANKGGTK